MARTIQATDNYWPRFSGMAVSIDTFKKGLERRGYEVFIFAPHYPNDGRSGLWDEGKVRRFASRGLFFTKEDRLVKRSEGRRVIEEMRGLDPDIVHVHTEFNMSTLAMRAARKLKVPLVMSCHTYFEQYINHYLPWVPHGFGRWYARKFTKTHFDKADIIVTPSGPMREVLRSYGVEREIAIIPTGIDPDGLKGADRAQERESSQLFSRWPVLKGKRVLLFLGRIGKEKNLSILPRVLSLVRKDFPSAHLLMVGDGPFRDELRSMFAKNGLKDKVTFTGYLDGAMKRSAFTLADVFVFPSVTETQGLVTAEAMMCGTPVVGVGEMGTKEVMGGDNGGFMVGNDPGEMAVRVRDLLQDGDLWRRKSKEALKRAELFSTETSALRLSSLYERILGKS